MSGITTRSPSTLKQSKSRSSHRSLLHLLPLRLGFAVLGFVLLNSTLSGSRSLAVASIIPSALLTVSLAIAVARTMRRRTGSVDPWHPSVFPALYISFSFLAPAWAYFVHGEAVGSLGFDFRLADQTPFLVAIAAAAFAIGTVLPRAEVTRRSAHEVDRARASALVVGGRLLLITAIIFATYNLYTGGARTRGIGQATRELSDLADVLLGVLSIAGIVLVLIGMVMRGRRRLMLPVDWGITATLAVTIALGGSRSPLLNLILPIALVESYRHRKHLRQMVAGFVGLMLMVMLVQYRVGVSGGEETRSILEIILGDMAPVTFTIGVTAAAVPHAVQFAQGSTLFAALVGQLPSPMTQWLVSDGLEAGGPRFRRIAGINNPDHGTAFSLPAEGYLNFGVVGVVATMVAIGWIFAWAYRRFSFGNRASAFLYPILIATMPFGVRNHALGAIKSVLYPLILIVITALIADAIAKRRGHPLRQPQTVDQVSSRALNPDRQTR